MKEELTIHCQAEWVEHWWMADDLAGICGARIVRVGSSLDTTQWHLAGYPLDFLDYRENEDFVAKYWEIMTERGFDFDRYELTLCKDCLEHEDLPLLVLALAGEIPV